MEYRVIDKKNKDIKDAIEQRRINDALNALQMMLEDTTDSKLKDEVSHVKTSYDLMLQYMSRGVMDPQREIVLQHIIDSIYSITDRGTIALKEQTSPMVFFARRRELGNTSLSSLVEDWKASRHKYELLSSIPAEQQNSTALMHVLKDCEKLETTVFNKIWSTFPTLSDDAQIITELFNKNYPVEAQCLFLSALFLGLMSFYDESKLVIIARAYINSESNEVQLRALIYTVLAIYMHNKCIGSSNIIKGCVESMAMQSNFAQDVSTIQFLLARSRNTDNISRRVSEDLMPGLMNVSPDLMQKIKEQDNKFDISELESNPEWQEMLENSGIAKKMEEFNELQLAGNDVFVSTFSHLKSFPFFSTLSNWFLPYNPNHSVVRNALGNGTATLGDALVDSPLCNSDKYSFCLSMASIPESQRHGMFSHVQAQHAELRELKTTELPNSRKVRESIANKHIQDLYRFFKFFSRRREFLPVFDSDMDFLSVELLKKYTSSVANITLIAEFYFKNGFYDDAIKCYSYILDYSDMVDPLNFQKLGFAHQYLGHYREALSYYRKYLLAHDNDQWTIKHVASCYRALGRHDKALECLKKIEELQPENLNIILNIGNCLLELGKTGEALQYYFKADFMPNSKHRAWRPIAWCSFLEGNYDRAMSYYDKIIETDVPTTQDYMNRGHVQLCKQQLSNALNDYRDSLKLGGNYTEFCEAFLKDKNQLIQRGISRNDIALILDVLSVN